MGGTKTWTIGPGNFITHALSAAIEKGLGIANPALDTMGLMTMS